MNSNPQVKKQDPFAGFLASVALALMLSNFLARHLIDFVSLQITLANPDIWKTDLAAGLFVGIVLADPVGNFLHHKTIPRFLLKFAFGFLLGVLVQRFVVMPMAGGGMSRYVFLILAVLLLPVLFCIETYKDFLRSRDLTAGAAIASFSLRLLGFPDRIIIVAAMAASFVAFWVFGREIQQVLIVLAVILAGTTLFVAFTRPDLAEDEDDDLWYMDEPQEIQEVSLTKQALARLGFLFGSVLPGAILLGGVMRMTLDVLLKMYPDVVVQMAEPVEMARTIGLLAASGFGVVVLGMMAALGAGLVVLLLIARVRKWAAPEIRQRSKQLIKVLCLRDLKRHS